MADALLPEPHADLGLARDAGRCPTDRWSRRLACLPVLRAVLRSGDLCLGAGSSCSASHGRRSNDGVDNYDERGLHRVSVLSLVAAPRAAAGGLLRKVAWSWAGVPSGPLGWVSAKWTMPVLHGPIYPVMASALELTPEDDLLEVACGSGVFLAEHAGSAHFVAGLDLSDVQVHLARRRLAARIVAGTAEIIKGDVGALP